VHLSLFDSVVGAMKQHLQQVVELMNNRAIISETSVYNKCFISPQATSHNTNTQTTHRTKKQDSIYMVKSFNPKIEQAAY